MRKLFRLPVLLLPLAIFCSGWGFLVHRTVHQLAVYELPGNLQQFFYRNMDYIVKYSVRPDQRRRDDSTEATKHYINLEAYGDSAAWKMPLQWKDAITVYTEDSLLKYGYVPYYIVMMKDRLTQAFKSGNKDSILFYATDMAHYIGDAHVPLHTTTNYDGQLTDQRGLHSLWETVIPELELTGYNLHSRHKARYLDNPSAAAWNAVRQAHELLNDLFEQEKEVTKLFTDSTKYRVQIRNGREYRYYTSGFAKAYSERLGNTIQKQLIRSAGLIADFWYTSWVDAGKPSMTSLLQTPFSKEDKKALKKECKAYKRNQLIEEGLLISKQSESED